MPSNYGQTEGVAMSSLWGHVRMKWVFAAGAAAFFVSALVLFAAPTVHALTIYGTANTETGTSLQTLATVFMRQIDPITGGVYPVIVHWGDGSKAKPDTSPGLLNCHYPVSFRCDILGTHVYAKAGTYNIKISYTGAVCKCGRTAGATAIISSLSSPAAANDFVILTIGDSIASGEGNPVIKSTPISYSTRSVPYAYWDNQSSDYPPTGRTGYDVSRNAGFFQAMKEVQKNNLGIKVVTFAQGGDTVEEAIQQLRKARVQMIGQQFQQVLPRIDVLLISVGADNLSSNGQHGFGSVVEGCIFSAVSTPCSQNSKFTNEINQDLCNLGSQGELAPSLKPCSSANPPFPPCQVKRGNALTGCYTGLAEAINCIGVNYPCAKSQIPKLVLITEYEDITHDQNGNFPTSKEDRLCLPAYALAPDWPYFYALEKALNFQVDQFPMYAKSAGLDVPTYAVTGIQQDFNTHGYCASSARWVNTLADSALLEFDRDQPEKTVAGAGHPNTAGQADYQKRIYSAIVAYNPPVTTAIATTTDGASYKFGTWTDQDVAVNFSSTNAIQKSGVGSTYYAVDNPNCSPGQTSTGNCTQYAGPVTISSTGAHALTFFGTNLSGNPEESHTDQVLVDKGPPLGINPATKMVAHGQSALFAVRIGHFGWDGQTVNLSCETNDPNATCTVFPRSVTLDPTSFGAANVVVSTITGAASLKSALPAQPIPIRGREALRALLALAAALFLAATGLAVRRRRWARVSSFAAFAVLFGVLCAGCGQTASTKTYTVTVTGVSGNSTNTGNSTLVVQ
jgi:hypothetical protein